MVTWGSGVSGQLGHGGTVHEARPRAVELAGRAVRVACGDWHTVAMLASGGVATWGAGRKDSSCMEGLWERWGWRPVAPRRPWCWRTAAC